MFGNTTNLEAFNMPIPRYAFASDNEAGVHPRILKAMIDCNDGFVAPYGDEQLTASVNKVFSEIFEREAFVFTTPTGTAANGLALGSITPSYGVIFSHQKAHIVTTECGAPEFYSNGSRIMLLEGLHNKISASTLKVALSTYSHGNLHPQQPSTVSLTQSTERGTVYDCEEIAEISEISHSAGLKVHMDGARFANALVHLAVSPAMLTWKSGVDVISFGTTKNGTMNAEAVVTFDKGTANVMRFLHKRAGLLFSKMRYQSAQLLAYLDKGLWLDNARAANYSAKQISEALSSLPGVRLASQVQSNEIFAHIPTSAHASFIYQGINLKPWPSPSGDLFRIVTSYNTPAEQITSFQIACNNANQELASTTCPAQSTFK